MAVTKEALLDWLLNDSVEVISADVEGLPGIGEVVTISLVNKDPGKALEGANWVTAAPPPTRGDKARAIQERQRVQEGWETDDDETSC